MTALRVRGWIAWRLRQVADWLWMPPVLPHSVESVYRMQLLAQIDDRSPMAKQVDRLYRAQLTRNGWPVREIVLPYLGPSAGPVALGSAIAGTVDADVLTAPLRFGSMPFRLVTATFEADTGKPATATYRAAGKFPDQGEA